MHDAENASVANYEQVFLAGTLDGKYFVNFSDQTTQNLIHKIDECFKAENSFIENFGSKVDAQRQILT
jgi:hypothetical protein